MHAIFLTQRKTRNNHAASGFLFEVWVLYSNRAERKIGPSIELKVKSKQQVSHNITKRLDCLRSMHRPIPDVRVCRAAALKV